jgi:hypothetical protein
MIVFALGSYLQMNKFGLNLPARTKCNPSGLWIAYGRSFLAFIKFLTDLLLVIVNICGFKINATYDIYFFGYLYSLTL